MKKYVITLIFISFFLLLIIFANQKVFEIYFSHKLSKWLDKDIKFTNFSINYPNEISLSNLEIKNSNPVFYESIFETKQVVININVKSFLFDDLKIINSLKIEKPIFYLEIIQKDNSSKEQINNNEKLYEDNIGIAKKLNEEIPDKIWPPKKKDINFIILDSSISNGKAFIKIPSFPGESEIILSKFQFSKIGNEKGYRHYKDVLKIILFDVFARVKNFEKKEILKGIYKF